MKDKERKPISITILVVIGSVGLGVSVLTLWFYFNTFDGGISADPNNWGLFGDFIGGSLNPILAFLGLIALLITIRLQSKELVDASTELKKSTKAMEEQSASLEKQNFESTFFQLMRLHNDIVSDLDLRKTKSHNVIHKGRDCFKTWLRMYEHEYRGSIHLFTDKSQYLGIIRKSYDDFYRDYESDIGHYFRNLYRIIKYIDESEVSNKYFYTGLIRAQLSTIEQALLFYNGLSSYGTEFKHFIERYNLLEHLNIDMLVDPENHYKLYKDRAYGDSTLKKPRI